MGLGAVIDRAIAPFAPGVALRRMHDRARLSMAEGSDYRGASAHRLLADWIIGSADPTPASCELNILRNRSRDLNRNDGVASGATETMALNVVGSGLVPQSRLRADVLGVSEEKAEELRRQAEAAWDLWSPLADAGNRLDFAEMQFQVMRKIVEDGEVVAVSTWADEKWRPFGRAIELVEADRLADPGKPGRTAKNGIETGARGEPVKYWIRRASPKNLEFVGIPARDSSGRPNILHIFPSRRPGQQRGVPLFAPVLCLFKHMADYLEAEVVAARVAACLAVFVTSGSDGMSMVQQDQNTSSTDADGRRIQSIAPGNVSYLEPGESINVVDPKRPGDTFAPFMEGVLRLIGASLGLPYELLLKDFSKTNYSSARAALLEGRRMFVNWRSWLSRRFCRPVWELVLEEAFLRGLFDAPDFYARRSEYCRAAWIGGGWGWVDPVKEVQSSQMAVNSGLSTLAEECAGQGRDWEEILEQIKREQDRAAELGVRLGGASAPTDSRQEQSNE